jgi:hypothetical protein
MIFSSKKYLKKNFCFDLIYRTNKNSLHLPYIKKCSFYVSHKNIFNLFCGLISIKIPLSFCGTKVSSKLIKFCSNTGYFFSSSLFLNKRSASSLIYFFSSVCVFKPIFVNDQQSFISLSFNNFSFSFPSTYTYYLSSLLFVDKAFNKKYSFFFSSSFCSGSVCLLSTFLPFFCRKKKVNNFRAILCEVEQSGLAR